MFYSRRSCFSPTTILALSFILTLTIIKDSDGSTVACNGGECHVFNQQEQEFLMDTEEHRQMLETAFSDGLASTPPTDANHISYKSLDPGKQACGRDCSAKGVVDVGRRCKLSNYSCR